MIIRHVTKADLVYLVALYCACFAEPPWFEKFNVLELTEEFEEMLSWSDTVFLVGEQDGQIIGGAIGFAVSRKKDLAVVLPEAFQNAFYFAELFVAKAFRQKGIAKQFALVLSEASRLNGFDCAVVRTSVDQPIIQHLYMETFGFKICATQETMSTKVIDGIEQELPDTRVIMVGFISGS